MKKEITDKFTSISDMIKSRVTMQRHVIEDIRYILKNIISSKPFQNLANTNKVFYDRIIQISQDESLTRKEMFNLCCFMQMLKSNNLDNIPFTYNELVLNFAIITNVYIAEKVIERFYEPKTITKRPICLYFIRALVIRIVTWSPENIERFWQGYKKSNDIFGTMRDYYSSKYYDVGRHFKYYKYVADPTELERKAAKKGYPRLDSEIGSVAHCNKFQQSMNDKHIRNNINTFTNYFNNRDIPEEALPLLEGCIGVREKFADETFGSHVDINKLLDIIKTL